MVMRVDQDDARETVKALDLVQGVKRQSVGKNVQR